MKGMILQFIVVASGASLRELARSLRRQLLPRRLSTGRDLACVVLIGQLHCALIGVSRSAFDAESARQCSAFL